MTNDERPATLSSYDLEPVKLPELSGRALAAAAAIARMPLVGPVLRRRLVAGAGVLDARKRPLDELPTFWPAGGTLPAAVPDGGLSEQTTAGAPLAGPFLSASDYAAAYREGGLTPSEVAAAVLAAVERTESLDPPLRAYIALDRDDVLRQAEAATERHRRGTPVGLLDGVPVSVKDEFDQLPYATTAGTRGIGRTPVRDATVVARLRTAGAVLVGKTNMHEIGIEPSGLNVHHGQARNPYNRSRDPGGSSSGSAVAVAAGIVPLALGADGGGSIRVPASFCGIVGLKPTFGRVSEAGAVPLCRTVAHAGPLGATVADVVLAYGLISGPDERDPLSLDQPSPQVGRWRTPGLAGIKLGVYPPWFDDADVEVVQANRALLDRLVAAGAEVREVVVPGLRDMRVAHAVTILSEMVSFVASLGEDVRRALGDSVRLTLEGARDLLAGDYLWAQQVRTRALAHFARVFSEVDAIVTPATPMTAPPIPDVPPGRGWSNPSRTLRIMQFVAPGNLCGLPAIAFPAGYDAARLPIGMQVMAPHWNEALLLRVASVAESVVERRAPAVLCRPIEK